MLFFSALTSLALATLAAAQANNTELSLEAIEAHFAQAGLSGGNNLITSFQPSALLTLSYDGVGAVSPGQALTATQVKPQPSLTITPANSTVTLTGQNYTVIMVDAGPAGTDETEGQTRHWLVNSVTLGSSGAASLDTAWKHGDYAGPGPAAGSGAHRYCVLVYAQPASFASPADIQDGIQVIQLGDYVKSSGLGDIVAGTYITVEDGTASFSVSATSAVVTSTLPAAQSSGTASGSHSGSASGSRTGSASGSAPSASTTGSASGAASFAAIAPMVAFFAGVTGIMALF
jgi:hypothetical protein